MHTFLYNYNNVLIRINFYMFLTSLAHPQGVHSCIKQPLGLIILSNMRNCRYVLLRTDYRSGYVH